MLVRICEGWFHIFDKHVSGRISGALPGLQVDAEFKSSLIFDPTPPSYIVTMSTPTQQNQLRTKIAHQALPGLAGAPIALQYLKLTEQEKLTAALVKLLNKRKEKLNLLNNFGEEQISFEADLTAAIWRAGARFRLAADADRCKSLKDMAPSVQMASSLDLHWEDLMDTVSRLSTISRSLILA
jgi:hypothetical protein